ncbi:GIY-YIG nuclease superfamily protein [Brevundimonas sp. SH203]|uniref:GIY-YIG nuclease family protein n=1 Tax=Brevundimonas sp. SH203 TaxID=345167 RepID=UPI0009D4CF46|nr:GIY-YIG nuclease family protein [Brevundimonas sp. SH203]GAW42490.1 GIY-YIG nuclease superfamily protein [Brevundimonas sp. SH203]
MKVEGLEVVGIDNQIGCYMMSNRKHGTLYIGVSAQLVARVVQHREGLIDGFTKRYGLKRLVWYEFHDTIVGAIQREKSLKRWPRDWKANLIERTNPDWDDLFDGLTCNDIEVAPDPQAYRDWTPPEA